MQSTTDQNNESTIVREKSRRREQVVVGLLGRLLRAGPFRFTIFFMYAAYLAVSGEIVKATWTTGLQGVPQLSIHFVLVVFLDSSACTDVYFTIFQQPRR